MLKSSFTSLFPWLLALTHLVVGRRWELDRDPLRFETITSSQEPIKMWTDINTLLALHCLPTTSKYLSFNKAW
ncbi:hypothetical protein BDR07DRAFT_1424079, partial [Suillus spraguei]